MSNIKENNIPSFKMIIIIVLIIWVIPLFLMLYFFNSWPERGVFGDSFGAVNALFSALGFGGLVYTVFLQREEMKQNRIEIAKNRKKLSKSARIQQKSFEIMERQVEQTHLTAKMNGLQTLLQYYNEQINNPQNSDHLITQAREKRRNIIKLIDELIEDIHDAEIE